MNRKNTPLEESIANLDESSRIITQSLQRIANANESAAAYMADSSRHLRTAATNFYDVSQKYRNSKEKLVDAVRGVEDTTSIIYEQNKERLRIPPKDDMH